jgi:hypothetical protein
MMAAMVARDASPGGNAASIQATDAALAKVPSAAAVILVEGITDQIALETAATLHGRDLHLDRVVIVPIGGAHAITRFLTTLIPQAPGARLAGLCDLREEDLFRRGLTAAGLGSPRSRPEMERLGFHVCIDDLEDELLRAVGPAECLRLFDAERDLRSFRSFQKQPAWRDQALPAQMYRFIRSSSRRNVRYAHLLTKAAAHRGTLPGPLNAVLTAASPPA